jgi:hypothetical protein
MAEAGDSRSSPGIVEELIRNEHFTVEVDEAGTSLLGLVAGWLLTWINARRGLFSCRFRFSCPLLERQDSKLSVQLLSGGLEKTGAICWG